MYHKAYGIIETLAPLHIGASAGEETGNLNLIFRDQFTQTGIIPGSSIRGRFRADMRSQDQQNKTDFANHWYGQEPIEISEDGTEQSGTAESEVTESEATRVVSTVKLAKKRKDTTEALVKFEYASLVWLPVFCPGQPIVWVTCPRLLKRYAQITGINPEGCSLEKIRELLKKTETKLSQHPVKLNQHHDRLFFNLGFLDNLQNTPALEEWVPKNSKAQPDNLVVVGDADISLIHDMALYRQTRTKLKDNEKIVDNFFGFEALPEDSILIFPAAIKKLVEDEQKKFAEDKQRWNPLVKSSRQLYFGGLESIGCGRCYVTLTGEYFEKKEKQ